MTTSLAFCANNGISLLVDPVNQPTVTHVYRGHQSICHSGATDLDIGCLAYFLVRNSGFIRGCGPNRTFLAT